MKAEPILAWVAMLVWVMPPRSDAGLTAFFDVSQVATLVDTGTTSDTISSEGYLFTYTRDKLFTGGGGATNPIGRPLAVSWPAGIEAQYVTAGPLPGKAKITIRRVDGVVFDLTSFTARLLANAGAGRSIEIVPMLNGEEPLNNPLYFDVSGNYGNEFSYDTSPNYLGSTAALTNYDTYVVTLTLDFALTALTLTSMGPNMNHPPTDIVVSNGSVSENEPAGTLIGTFSTTDPDIEDTFSYTFVAGTGSEDNGAFSISGSNLLTAGLFNYEAKSNYSIRVQSTDQGLLSTQMVFAISILDVNESPDFLGLEASGGNKVIVTWRSVTNHLYTVRSTTNLLNLFSVVESNIIATPMMNIYTDSVQGASSKFWQITTEP